MHESKRLRDAPHVGLDGGGAWFGSSYLEVTCPVCTMNVGLFLHFRRCSLSWVNGEQSKSACKVPAFLGARACHIRDICRISRAVSLEIQDLYRGHMKSQQGLGVTVPC